MKYVLIFLAGALTGWALDDAAFRVVDTSFKEIVSERTATCEPPNGALHKLHGGFGLKDLKFSCIPKLATICGGHFCTSFTAMSGDRHIYGYVWRDSFNGLETSFCSPDGAWPGGWDGECPEGVAIDSEREYVKALAR